MTHPNRGDCQRIYNALNLMLEDYRQELDRNLEDTRVANDVIRRLVQRNENLQMRLAKMQTGISWRRSLELQTNPEVRNVINSFIELEDPELWTLNIRE